MPECLIQEVMLLLLAWLITSSYRDWQLIKRERAKRQARRPKVRRGVGKEKKGDSGFGGGGGYPGGGADIRGGAGDDFGVVGGGGGASGCVQRLDDAGVGG